jgi:hypothetical protein
MMSARSKKEKGGGGKSEKKLYKTKKRESKGKCH